MKDSKDLRFRILQYLQENGSSTEEVQCNKFLSTLHKDLATIRRTLKELIEKGYINESNIDWDKEKNKSIIYNLDTTGSTGQQNNRIERLIDPNDIKTIRLYLTLDGKKFLIESENLRRITFMIKYDFLIKLLFMVIGALVAFAGQFISNKFFISNNEQKDNSQTINTTMRQDGDKRIDTPDNANDSTGN